MFRVVAYALGLSLCLGEHTSTELPKIVNHGRVVELMNGEHFDNLMQDTPDEMRPPSLVLFFNHTDAACMETVAGLEYKRQAETSLPSRERLLVTKYNMHAAPKRIWFTLEPERDLAQRWGIDTAKTCPTLVLAPGSCKGVTEWCTRSTQEDSDGTVSTVGCEEYVEECDGREVWQADAGVDWVDWVTESVEQHPVPKLSPEIGSYTAQGKWMVARDRITAHTYHRNSLLPLDLPAFSKKGYATFKIPEPVYEWLLDFYDRNQKERRVEPWAADRTQMNFHEHKIYQVDLDLERAEADKLANEHIRPLLEEWVGRDLQLTSYFGVREYFPGSRLRNHVDRSETHVISVTMSLERRRLPHEDPDLADDEWPLEFINWEGNTIRYSHKPGYMVLYESARLPHGRPYPLKSGMHTGAFLHYTVDADSWRDQVDVAFDHLKSNLESTVYKSRPSVELEDPVFTEYPFGRITRDPGDEEVLVCPDGTELVVVLADEEEQPADNSNRDVEISLFLKNDDSKLVHVYWIPHEIGALPVYQGKIPPGITYLFGSYLGHAFFFATDWEDKEGYRAEPTQRAGIQQNPFLVTGDGTEIVWPAASHDEL